MSKEEGRALGVGEKVERREVLLPLLRGGRMIHRAAVVRKVARTIVDA